ncbi:uncharacterized protein LOC130263303 [Oenanthe melanoleuca]|uniref:uncharacterized protein LOC130263303 n=1 Tax=Oenanthe melanoleuca TaxID=2939378 RepID=UPI0024C18D1F|nr:uncharacterized protein LOC130263303 [Oenanthe melanoleuca]
MAPPPSGTATFLRVPPECPACHPPWSIACPRVSPECPRGVAMAMELRELSRALLESQVAVVAALGRLVATVAGPEGDVLLAVSPESLHKALDAFRDHLWDTLAAFGATPGPSRADVAGAAGEWHRSVAAVADRWTELATEAVRLGEACGAAVISEREAAATSSGRAGDLGDIVRAWASSLRELVATARRVPVVTDKEEEKAVLERHNTRLEEATKELKGALKRVEESTVARSKARAAARRAERAAAALGPLQGLVVACAEAIALHLRLSRRAGDTAAALAEAERLREASARLFTRHLRGTLGDILMLLPNGPGGPGGHAVAQRCQKAMEDIPSLLRGE